MTIQATSSMAPLSSLPVTVQRSPWHSPVPYLFGGLAAMLGLIAFALLILACSCCRKITPSEQDLESGNSDQNQDSKLPVDHKKPLVFEDKCLVIMAGQVNPTFLATPVSSRVSSVGSCSSRSDSMASTDTSSVLEEEKDKSCDEIQVRNAENLASVHELP